MKTVELSTASKLLSAYAEEFNDETVVLTLNGEAIAVVTAIKDIDLKSLALSTNPEFLPLSKMRDKNSKQVKSCR